MLVKSLMLKVTGTGKSYLFNWIKYEIRWAFFQTPKRSNI